MSDNMTNMTALLERINKTIARNETNLASLRAQRDAVLAILTPPTPAVKK